MTTTPDRPATLGDRVAEEVRATLARRRISGSELARRMGVRQMYVQRRLTGEVEISLNDLERVAAVLEMNPLDLIPLGRVPGNGDPRNYYVRSGAVAAKVRPPRRWDRVTRPGEPLPVAA